MIYLSSVSKCIFTLYLVEEALHVSARHKVHGTKIKIDEFIDKLLASKKFDVLAEKFAQKAVERMFNLKPSLRYNKDMAAHIRTPQKVTFRNVSHNTEVHLEKTSSPLKNLSLKFKYFTKGAFYNIRSEEDKETIDTKEIQEEPFIKNFTIIENKADIKDEAENESINISDLETSLQDRSDNTNDSSKNKYVTSNEKVFDENKTKKPKQNELDGSISTENKRNAQLLSDNELPEDHKKNESHAKGFTSDFDKNVKRDRALFRNELKEVNNKELKNRHKKRCHKEGNRIYTFQSSSDYDEYHRELERVEKERNVFV